MKKIYLKRIIEKISKIMKKLYAFLDDNISIQVFMAPYKLFSRFKETTPEQSI